MAFTSTDPSPSSSIHRKYRADIDGLRAIAIILVIGYHAFPNLFKNGFIGVDIFFVISGFLISSIIFDNLDINNFSYKEFYARRIKRIFPALIVILIACIVLGNFYLLTDEYKALGKNITAATLYISNFATWAEAGYFDTANYSKPLLHLWSLAIEEQFYFFWPLLLGFLWKRGAKQHFLLVIFVIGIFSFCINALTAGNNPTADFYSPLSRFWELMVGGLLAYISIFRPHFLKYNSGIRSTIGFILIILALIFIDQNLRSYPGWWALLPTAGAFLLISAKPDAWLNRNILSRKIFVWVGLISYPLYLWHWPLLSFTRIIFGQNLSTTITVFVVIMTFILSWLTYKFIEKPIRSKKQMRHIILILILSMSIIFFYGLLIFIKNGFPNRSINTTQHLYNPALHIGLRIPFFGIFFSDDSCSSLWSAQFKKIDSCRLNSTYPQLLFGGDSHAAALYSSIQVGHVSAPSLLISGGACPLYNLASTSNNCSPVVDDFIAAAAMPSIKDIFIVNANRYVPNPKTNSNYMSDGKVLTEEEAFLIGYSNLLDKLSTLNKRIVFVLDIPHLDTDPRDCVKRSMLHDNSKKDCGVDVTMFQSNRLEYLKLVYQLKEKYPELIMYDASKNLCDNSKCLAKDETDYFYNDYDHITVYGSELILSNLFSELNIIVH